jgi:hypothetical protein
MAAVAANDYIYVSTDYGVTWVAENGSGSHNWYSVAMSSDGKNLVASDEGGYLYTSVDYGVTWTQQTNSGTRIWGEVSSSGNGQYLVSGDISNGDIFTSADYGATWTDRTAPGSQGWVAFTTSYSGQYMSAVAWLGDVWTSNDYGATWTDRTGTPLGTQEWDNVTASSSGQYIAAAVGYGDIYESTDYGATWTDVTPDAPVTGLYWQGISYNASAQYLFGAVRGGDIYVANDPSLAPVTSAQVNNSVSANPVSVVTPAGTQLTETNAVTAASLASKDTSFSYPLGLVNLCMNTVNADNTISLTFVTSLTPSQVVLRDYNSLTNTYTTVAGATITETTLNGAPALQASYSLVDNGPLDSNSTLGVICDPIGLASANPPASAPNTGLPGQTSPAVVVSTSLLLGTSTLGLGFALRRKQKLQ